MTFFFFVDINDNDEITKEFYIDIGLIVIIILLFIFGNYSVL